LMHVSRQSFYAMRKGDRRIPPYIDAFARLLLRVPADLLLDLERETKGAKRG